MNLRFLNVRSFVGYLIAAVLLAVITLVVAHSHSAYAYVSAADVNNYLPNARNTIVSVENQARDLNYPCGTNRTCLNNQGMPYWRKNWVSPRNAPSAGEQLTLPATTTTINLQLNSFFFLTAATAARDYGSTTGLGTVRYDFPSNRVTSGNYPDDRRPAASPTVNYAAIKASRNKIYSARVVSGGGTLSNVPIGTVFGTSTDPYSRYAFGTPVGFTYNSGRWTGLQRTVTIEFEVANIQTFHSAPPGGTSQCYNSRGRLLTLNYNAFDSCRRETVRYDFTFFVVPVWYLAPSIDLYGKKIASVDERVPVTPVINNTAEGASNGTYWSVSSMTYPSGASIPTGVTTSNNNGQTTANPARPCTHIATLGASNCRTEATGTGNYRPGLTTLADVMAKIGNYPIGTKVCFVLSVFSRDNTDLDVRNQVWAHSAPACLTIGKYPMVDVVGSDLIVGRSTTSNITTSTSIKDIDGTQRTFGSWSEYGIVVSGVATGMASGSGYVGGSTAGDFCQLSILTFTRGTGCNDIGHYTKATIAPNVSARFPINVAADAVRPGFVADPAVMPTATLSVPNASVNLIGNNLSGHYQAPAGVENLTITGGNSIPKGRWVVVNAPEATVTITGNITYTGDTMTSMTDIPQVVIIAKNIIIADSVGQIDAWLITTGTGADGRINTCGAGGVAPASELTHTTCNNKLTINGPVIANHLIMRRTYGAGAGAASGEPAEVFNLRADAYLWATNYNLHGGRIPTVATKELPPRF